MPSRVARDEAQAADLRRQKAKQVREHKADLKRMHHSITNALDAADKDEKDEASWRKRARRKYKRRGKKRMTMNRIQEAREPNQ